jgi:hypothetical protein
VSRRARAWWSILATNDDALVQWGDERGRRRSAVGALTAALPARAPWS